jgi:hypothetical protein
MIGSKKTSILTRIARTVSVLLMIFCLTLLTGLNFLIYAGDATCNECVQTAFGCEEPGGDYPPSGPTEEKSASSGTTISEEILHELHPEFNFRVINQLYKHHIAEADNMEMFHPELILPPPRA